MRYIYSRWDGLQSAQALHGGELMDELAEHLLTSGDLNQALRSLLQRGARSPSGYGMRGLQDLLEQLRHRRQELLARYDLAASIDDLRQRLERIVEDERAGVERRLREARQRADAAGEPGGPVSQAEAKQLLDLMERLAAQHRAVLDALPREPGGAIQQLSHYDFMDGEAKARFDELLQLLQQKMLESHVKEAAERLRGLTPAGAQRLRELLESLNEMLEQKLRGQEPDFKGFMDRYGAAFGDHPPETFEELAERLHQQTSQIQSLLESLPAAQRDALQRMLDASIQDPDLRGELAQLAANLNSLLAPGGEPSEYLFTGREPVTLQEAMQLMGHLQRLDDLERQLGRARQSGTLADVDAQAEIGRAHV
jgi:uncharacterized protein with von Willebrand factor type A (vWA) domain